MAELDTSVAMLEENEGTEQPADDAQAAEITAEELVANLMGEGSAPETVENEGDNGQGAQEPKQQEQPKQETGEEKVGRRIASALKSQKEQIYRDLGMSEAEVRELIRAHKAEQMHKEDPEISPKAARRILEAQEKAAQPENGARVAELTEGLKGLMEDGYTLEDIKALVADEDVRADVAQGKTMRQAAHAYERRQRTQTETSTKKRAPRTARSTAAGDSPEPNLIASIPEDKYDAFMADLRRRAMAGEKIRI